MSATPNKRLSFSQLRGIVALMTHRSVKAAAKRIQMNPKTLKRWMRNPLFIAVYEKKAQEMFAACTATMQASTNEAFEVLLKQMRTCDKSSDRIRAASAVISFAIQANEISELREAIARVERFQAMFERREIYGENTIPVNGGKNSGLPDCAENKVWAVGEFAKSGS